jgi:hypothetical protein
METVDGSTPDASSGGVGAGGTSASAGGTSASAGGTSTGAGGTSAGTGGAGTVGDAGTGGTASGTGGGGTVGDAGTGGTASGTGGGGTVGDAGTGGTASGTGGAGTVGDAGTGGTASGTGGAASGAGGTISGAGGAGGTAAGGTAGTGAGGSASGGTGGGCGPDDTACSPSVGVNGFCSGGVCVACSGSADNAACSAAYGNGAGYVCAQNDCVPGNCVTNTDCPAGELCGASTANQCGACASDAACTGQGGYGAGYLCIGGKCVQANCRQDSNCATGEICGVQTPNVCGKCTADSQCQNDPTYGKNFVCDTSSGTCVSSACTPNNQACSQNGKDFCCGGACVTGDCCDTNDCSGLGNNYTCVNHTCTLCPQATNNTFYVDPIGGNDTVGTGSSGTAGCAFKTITRALSFIGANPNDGTQILVEDTGSVGLATNGETFPIVVPHNVTVSGTGGRTKILVPAAATGFVLHQQNSGLSNLELDGQNHTAAHGVRVTTGSDDTTSVSHLFVHAMAGDGILVHNVGQLDIGPGVTSTGNGTQNAPADGLHVTDNGVVTIDVTSGDAVHLDSNTAHGILVDGSGSITLTGKPGAGGTGTVTTNENGFAGLWIEQTPGAGAPNNVVTGLVSWANTANGIRLVGGSAVTLRGSVALANQANGVLVSTYVNGAIRSNNTSLMDLGTAGQNPSYGGNTFQASLGANPNLGAGICLSLDRTAGSKLNAAGNVFAGPTNCASSTATLTSNATCSKAVDVSVRTTGPTANSIDVSQCK